MNLDTLRFMATATAMIALLTAFALRSEAETAAYKITRRIFWAVAALWCGSSVGLSLNLFTAGVVACFGAPAYAALIALSRFQ